MIGPKYSGLFTTNIIRPCRAEIWSQSVTHQAASGKKLKEQRARVFLWQLMRRRENTVLQSLVC